MGKWEESPESQAGQRFPFPTRVGSREKVGSDACTPARLPNPVAFCIPGAQHSARENSLEIPALTHVLAGAKLDTI
jgi:hypothetical protein